MSRRIFEQCILIFLFMVFSVFVLVMVSFLHLASTTDMNYNEFFSSKTFIVRVSPQNESGEFTVNITDLGDNFSLTRSVGMTSDYSKDSVRAVSSKGDFYIPTVYEGRYITQKEFDSDAPVCVVGKLVAERSLKIGEGGKKYYNFYGVDYEVVGYIGIEKTTDLDNMVIINMNCFNKDMNYFATYYVDAKNKKDVETVTNNFVQEFNDELFEKRCLVSVSERENTSVIKLSTTTAIFYIALAMLTGNILLSIYQYVNKQSYSAAVKKLCGFSMIGVILELVFSFFVMSSVGFVFGALMKDSIWGKLISSIDSSIKIPKGYDGAWIAYVIVLAFVLFVSLATAIKIYRRDTSGFLKAKD